MSWSGGSDVFERMAIQLLSLPVSDAYKQHLCAELIDALRDCGWDAANGLGLVDSEIVDQAFDQFDIYRLCFAEHETQPWQCEMRLHHKGDHDDYSGHTWCQKTP